MKNTIMIQKSNFFSNITSTITDSFNKLSGDNITKIIVVLVGASTIRYICANGGNLHIENKDVKVSFQSSGQAA